MEKCIADLFSAVTQIDKRYFSSIGTRADHTQYPQVIENSFTAELYHRFKSICELPINTGYYDNLILHFDINKMAGDLRPDLVLHETQENRNNQKLFIEVKTDERADLANDFEKLLYSINGLEFKQAVIVIVNRNFPDSKELVSGYFRNVNFDIKQKLFLININTQDQDSIDYNLFQFSSIRKNQ